MTKLVNKIIALNNRRTSMRLCHKEWLALKEICLRENITPNRLIELIENKKNSELGLTYATRLFTLVYFQNLANKYSKPRRGNNSKVEPSAKIIDMLECIK